MVEFHWDLRVINMATSYSYPDRSEPAFVYSELSECSYLDISECVSSDLSKCVYSDLSVCAYYDLSE